METSTVTHGKETKEEGGDENDGAIKIEYEA